MKKSRLLKIGRYILVAICFCLAIISQFVYDDKELYGFAYAIAGIVVACHGRWVRVHQIIWTLLGRAWKIADRRATKVQLETRCLVVVNGAHCMNMADYIISTSIDDPERSTNRSKYRDINCCREHHPHSDKESRGQRADELFAMCKKENLSIHYISPILRYRIK